MVFPKKNDSQCLENYRPFSLPPICGKVLESLIINEMFPLFIKNGLILENQLGFRPGDSCVNQHLSITHETYKSFDDRFDARSIFPVVITKTDNDHKRPANNHKSPSNNHKPSSNNHKPLANYHKPPANNHKQHIKPKR